MQELDELADTFEMLGDWEERYRYLIDLGRKLPALPAEQHTEANKVRGCMSQVWMTGHAEPGPPLRLVFQGDSDAHIVKGLIAVLFKLTSGKTPREILDADIGAAFSRLGLESHLSMNRRNGFYAMVERIRAMAAQAAQGAPAGAEPAH
ncbi:MAG: SufE family protein [Nevskia sp.]|nr:SufE family protein [Nevskia sp.]